MTLPDLSYAIHLLSQFMDKPKVSHWEAAQRVVCYLKGSPGQGILLRAKCDMQLRVYCDADCASCPLSRRSLTAFVVFLGQSPVAWKTTKQDTVSHSSAESEYRAMSAATREIKWHLQFFQEIGHPLTKPVHMYCDSQAAIHIAANPVFHERTKHIEKDCHNVRDAVTAGRLKTFHVRTHNHLADILTKSLGYPDFVKFLPKLGVLDLHTPT